MRAPHAADTLTGVSTGSGPCFPPWGDTMRKGTACLLSPPPFQAAHWRCCAPPVTTRLSAVAVSQRRREAAARPTLTARDPPDPRPALRGDRVSMNHSAPAGSSFLAAVPVASGPSHRHTEVCYKRRGFLGLLVAELSPRGPGAGWSVATRGTTRITPPGTRGTQRPEPLRRVAQWRRNGRLAEPFCVRVPCCAASSRRDAPVQGAGDHRLMMVSPPAPRSPQHVPVCVRKDLARRSQQGTAGGRRFTRGRARQARRGRANCAGDGQDQTLRPGGQEGAAHDWTICLCGFPAAYDDCHALVSCRHRPGLAWSRSVCGSRCRVT